jgi:hypothetical protein
MISGHRQATRAAMMPALPERFRHGGTAGTALRGAGRINLHPETASFHRVAEQDEDERAPRPSDGGIDDKR